MKNLKAFLLAMREVEKGDFLGAPMAWGPLVQEMINEVEACEAKIGLLTKAADESIGRVIEMNDRIVELKGALEIKQESLEVMYKAQNQAHERIMALNVKLFAAENAVKEMGEKIDADAALVVSLREMPFMCFADDPHAAIAAIVKADIDGAPIDWKQWPVVI